MNFTRRNRLELLVMAAINAWKDAHDKSNKLLEPKIPVSMILELHEDLDDIMFALELLAGELLYMDEGEGDSTPRPSNN